jgi:gas vesicle protein
MNEDRIYYSHDSEKHALGEMKRSMLLLLVGGLSIGAAVALLFAPSTGKQTRHDLAKTVEEGLKDGREAVGPLVKQLEKEIADLRKNIEDRTS